MISRRLLARSIADRLSAGEDQTLVMKQLAAYILTNRLKNQAEMIVGDIEAELSARGFAIATATTASKMNDGLRKQLTSYLKAELGSKSVNLSEKVDPSIIGGIIIETPGRMLDASVSGKLKRLRTTG